MPMTTEQLNDASFAKHEAEQGKTVVVQPTPPFFSRVLKVFRSSTGLAGIGLSVIVGGVVAYLQTHTLPTTVPGLIEMVATVAVWVIGHASLPPGTQPITPNK